MTDKSIKRDTLSETERIIDETVFNEKHRDILKRKLLDGLTFETVAEEFDMSARQIQRIVYDYAPPKRKAPRCKVKYVPLIA